MSIGLSVCMHCKRIHFGNTQSPTNSSSVDICTRTLHTRKKIRLKRMQSKEKKQSILMVNSLMLLATFVVRSQVFERLEW